MRSAALESAPPVDDDAARRAWLAVLQADPTCLEALLEIARLALRGGFVSAARTAYEQAILCHPSEPAARVNLGNLLIESGDANGARQHLDEAVRLAPSLATARHGFARVLTALGDTEAAAPHWRAAFATGAAFPQPYRGAGEGIRVLLLVSAVGGNIPTRALLDDTVFAVTALYPEFHDPRQPLPAHDLVFNAIADADLCAAPIVAAARVAAVSGRPVLNAPTAVASTGRADVARRMAALSGMIAPHVRRAPREELDAATDLAFPLLLRAPGFNTGRHFVRVERRDALAGAVAGLPGEELLVIEPLNCRSADGLFRKYRVMSIAGSLYPVHLAISTQWKVHYFSADMAERPEHRAEEQAFLEDPRSALGQRAMDALGDMFAELGLDYAGADFGLARDGRVMLFEANAGMVIAPPGSEPIWDYRRAPIGRAIGAARRMLSSAALPGPAGSGLPPVANGGGGC